MIEKTILSFINEADPNQACNIAVTTLVTLYELNHPNSSKRAEIADVGMKFVPVCVAQRKYKAINQLLWMAYNSCEPESTQETRIADIGLNLVDACIEENCIEIANILLTRAENSYPLKCNRASAITEKRLLLTQIHANVLLQKSDIGI